MAARKPGKAPQSVERASSTKRTPDDPSRSVEILNLSTVPPPRPVVVIDEKPYGLAVADDFSIADQHLLARDGDRFLKLWEQERLTDSEVKQLKLVLDRTFEKVMSLPAEVKAKINDGNRARIVMAYLLAPYLNETEGGK